MRKMSRRNVIKGLGAAGAIAGLGFYVPRILSRRGDKPNIVLVTLDTQKRERLGCYGYGRDTSPFIDSLAGEGTVFEKAYSQACFTLLSIGSKMTSRYPRNEMPLGIYWDDAFGMAEIEKKARQSRPGSFFDLLANLTSSTKPYELETWLQSFDPMWDVLEEHRGGITLAEKLEQEGYFTVGAVSMSQLKPSKGFARGFDRYSIEGKFRAKTRGKRNGDLTVKEAQEMLLGSPNDKPLFLWLHLFDVHGPFIAPKEYHDFFSTAGDFDDVEGVFEGFDATGKNRFYSMTEKESVEFSDTYDGHIKFQDKNLEAMLEFMDEKGLFDKERDVLVISADHGEDIMTHGLCGFHSTLYETVTHVPLIFYGKGVPKGKRVSSLVANLDIAPTLVEIAGGKIPEYWEGQNLKETINGVEENSHPYVFTDTPTLDMTSIKTAGTSLIYDFRTKKSESYDLEKDPYEISDLGANESLLNLALEYGQKKFDTVSKQEDGGNLSEEEKQQLKSMGYLDF